jgi:hypothetical protein
VAIGLVVARLFLGQEGPRSLARGWGMSGRRLGTGLLMRTHETLPLKPAQGWLMGCVMAAIFVLMGVSGDDVYARHVGMSVSMSSASPEAEVNSTAVSSNGRLTPGDAVPARRGHSSDERGDAAHTLHLLGACLAILCAAAVLLHLRGRWPGSTHTTSAWSPRLTFPASWLARVLRAPPPRDPPRFSPVIRT